MVKTFKFYLTIICTLSIITSCNHLKEAKNNYKNQNYDKTISYCEQALKIDSSDTDALVLMGKCYQQKGLLDKALKITKKAYKLSPNSKNITTELINTHNSIGNKNKKNNKYEALFHYKAAIEIMPKHKNTQKKLANTYYALGQLKKAKIYYLKIQNKKNKTSISNIIEKIDIRIEKSKELNKKGLVFLKQSNLKSALYYFKNALKEYPGSEDVNYHLLMTKGRILYKKGSISDLWNAIELFGKASALQNENGEPWYWIGLSYHKKNENEFTNAIDSLTKALRLEPNADFSNKCREKLQEIINKKKKMDKFWGSDK